MSTSDRMDEIEQAARVIGSVMSRWDMDGRPDVAGGIDTLIARALHEAGLLAPAPLAEEWATRFPNGHLRPGKDRDYNLWFKGDPPQGVNVRRYVTDWEES